MKTDPDPSPSAGGAERPEIVAEPAQTRPVRAEWTHTLDLVFLVGCPRSGTTWLQAMLAAHPQVWTGPETHFFDTLAPVDGIFSEVDSRSVGLRRYLGREAFYEQMEEFYWAMLSVLPEPGPQARVFLDKTPQHALHVDFILRTFPKARILHIIRDPRAVVWSLIRSAHSWAGEWAPKEVDRAIRLWSEHVRAGLSARERVADASQYFEVRYEDLRTDCLGNMRRICQWMGIGGDDGKLEQIVRDHAIDKAREGGGKYSSIPKIKGAKLVEKQIHQQGFVGPAPVTSEEVGLTRLQRTRIEHRVGSLMVDLGYGDRERKQSLVDRVMSSRKLRRLLGLPPL